MNQHSPGFWHRCLLTGTTAFFGMTMYEASTGLITLFLKQDKSITDQIIRSISGNPSNEALFFKYRDDLYRLGSPIKAAWLKKCSQHKQLSPFYSLDKRGISFILKE